MMFRIVFRALLAAFCSAALPVVASSEPIKLKLSFFTSDRSLIYQNSIKPFVDAVNGEGGDLLQIEVYFSGVISPVQSEQPKLLTDGRADIALIVPGQSPGRFPDSDAVALPGLLRDSREASAIYGRLASQGGLAGYQDYFVIGTFVSGPEYIHSRKPIASLEDLKGLTIRTNNKIEAEILERLGAIPVQLAINNTTAALTGAKIDAATFPPSVLFEFGLGRIANNHYLLPLGGAPTALLMNRKKFESLPPAARAIIEKYSGQWLSDRSSASFATLDRDVLAQLESDPRRQVVTPSEDDLKTFRTAVAWATDRWLEGGEERIAVMEAIKREVARSRESTGSR